MTKVRIQALDGPLSATRTGGEAPFARLARLPAAALETLLLWQERARQRHQLAGLDDRLLRDMGIGRAEAWREAAVPFWRAR